MSWPKQTSIDTLNIKWKIANNVMLNIFFSNSQRIAHQNYNEVSPHTSQNGHHQKSTNSKCWKEYGEKGTLLHFLWEGNLIQPLWRTVWRVLKKLTIELPYDPCMAGHTSRENHNLKRHMHLSIHCSTIYSSRQMNG